MDDCPPGTGCKVKGPIMFTDKTLQEVQEGRKKWEKEAGKAGRQKAKKGKRFSTVSDLEIKEIYTPEDIKDLDYSRDIG